MGLKVKVYETKILGVIIDHMLCWKRRIENVKRKLSKSNSVLFKTRHLLNRKCLHILCHSPILPYMSYCVEVWGNIQIQNNH